MTGTLRSVREKRERTRLQRLRDDAKKLKDLDYDIADAERQLGQQILLFKKRGFTAYWIAEKLGRTAKEIEILAKRAKRVNAGA